MPLTLESHAARFPELGASERDVFVLLEVSGEAPSGSREHHARASEMRAPLCLAIAIDASSSMRGTRFALALQATRNVLSSLGPHDRLAVVTFDRSARVVFGPTALDDEGQAQALRALDRLATGIGTNLGAGWREASEAVLRVMVPGAIRRVLVLTDGYPSRGETQPEALRARVAEGFAKGVETGVVGIGDGIDEKLCSALASAGDGRFHYVRDEGVLGDVVAAEVDGAKAVVARDVNVMLALSPRVERAELLHRYACHSEGRTMVVRIGSLTHDNPRAVLFSAALTEGPQEALVGVATAHGERVRSAARIAAQKTAVGFALGRADDEPTAVETERQSLTIPNGSGYFESRMKVAWELLVQRTLAEVRSAWDAMDSGDREAVARRLDRARTLRKILGDLGLVTATRLATLPDVDVVQEAMFLAGGASREARKRFASWAHNTQVSFVGAFPRKDK
ncbi:MAG: VWA domain-containing protein [Polyangiales bacterium]